MTRGRALPLDIAVCILFLERLEQTVACLKSFLSSGVPIHILSNGSSAASRAALDEFCKPYPQVRITDAGENLGVAGGRNRLIENSREPWLFFVDSDVVMASQDWTERFYEAAETNPDIEVFSPRLFNVHDEQEGDQLIFRMSAGRVTVEKKCGGETNGFLGGAAIVRRSLFSRLGGYDENLFVGFEDFELCIRALKAGHPVRVLIVPEIQLSHLHLQADNEIDRDYARLRYDHERIRASFTHLCRKHDLILEDPWSEWVREQLRLVLGED